MAYLIVVGCIGGFFHWPLARSDDAVLDREVNHELHPRFRLTSPNERTALSAAAYRQL
jgi:hypothetical protein